MNKNVLTIGMVVGAMVSIASPINAQSIVANRFLLAQSERNNSPSSPKTDSQGCVYEKEAPGSGGRPTKLCRNPQFNGIRIDRCVGRPFGLGCNTESSAKAFCQLQGDEYTEKLNDGTASLPISQTISINDGKICSSGRCYPFTWIRCMNPNSVANNKPKKDRSAANQSERSSERSQRKSPPLFKGALDLANTRQFTISVPIGNGKRQDVPIRVTESGQLIDPLTNQVAVPIERSKLGNTMGRKIIDNVIQKARREIGKYRNYSDVEKLQLSLDLYGAIPDFAELIEIRLKRAPNINIASNVSMEIASGFITGKYPSYMKDLDGLGISPLFNRLSKEVKNVNDYIDNKIIK